MHAFHTAAPIGALALFTAGAAMGQADTTAGSAAPEVVIVTGNEIDLTEAAVELAKIPGGTSLIDMTDLGDRNVANLADALKHVPGVWAVSPTGDDNIYFSSRGSNLDAVNYDANGIKLLQDGLPVTTADGNNHNRVIDPLAAGYATMARGANALSYGASTLGGAINFVTPTARDSEGTQFRMTTGSHGLAEGRLTVGRLFGESGDALVTVEGKSRDGYREHSEQDRGGIYGNAGWQLSDDLSTRFYLTVIHNDSELSGPLSRDQIAADPDQANAAVTGNFQVDVDTVRLANRTVLELDGNRQLEFGLSIEEQSLFHPIVWSPFFSLLIDSDQSNIGTMLRYRQQAGDHELIFGLNYGETDVTGGNFSHTDGEPTALWALIDNSASTAELFAMDRWQIGNDTMLVLSAQAVSADRDARTTSVPSGAVANPQASYDRINPRIGIVQSLGARLDVYGNLSTLYEPPTNYELEDNVQGGNAILKAMQGEVFEIGLRGGDASGAPGSLAWDVNYYRAGIDDEILSVDDPLAPGTSLTTNVDRTIHAGIEAMFRGTLRAGNRGGTLEPLVTLTVNDFRFDGDQTYGNNELPAAPAYFARGELIYRSADGYFVGPTFEQVGDRWADFANTYRVEGYTLYGLRGGFARGNWRAFVDVRNVTDEDYIAYHSVRNQAAADASILYPGEPLTAVVGFEFSLD